MFACYRTEKRNSIKINKTTLKSENSNLMCCSHFYSIFKVPKIKTLHRFVTSLRYLMLSIEVTCSVNLNEKLSVFYNIMWKLVFILCGLRYRPPDFLVNTAALYLFFFFDPLCYMTILVMLTVASVAYILLECEMFS
jgi:hypothetical protein